MKIFLVYIGTFIGTSIIDALWHVFFFGQQYSVLTPPLLIPEILSRILFVTALVFMILYKTEGHPTMQAATITGSVTGILAISLYGLTNYALHTWSLELSLLEIVIVIPAMTLLIWLTCQNWGALFGKSKGVN